MDVVDAAVIAVVVLTFATGILYRLRRDVLGPLGKRGRLLAFAALGVFLGWIATLNVGSPDGWASRPAVAVSVVVLEAVILTALIFDSVRAGRIAGRHAKN